MANDKEDRLAAALRANLKRRKAQARETAAVEGEAAPVSDIAAGNDQRSEDKPIA